MDNTKENTNRQTNKPQTADTSNKYSSKTLPYLTSFNEVSEKFEVKANKAHQGQTNSTDLLAALKQRHPQVNLVLDHFSGDTAYIRIPNAQHLTQNMGSAGATLFLIEATYGFTAIPHVEVVNFAFKEGDHAVPGAYTRQDFQEFLK